MQTNIKGGRASLLYKTIGMEKGDFYGAAVLVKAKLLLAPRALPALDLGQKLAQGPLLIPPCRVHPSFFAISVKKHVASSFPLSCSQAASAGGSRGAGMQPRP